MSSGFVIDIQIFNSTRVMIMRIFKWTLQLTDLQELQIPRGARVLSVQTQNDIPRLWALVDEREPLEKRCFATYGTGNPIPAESDFSRFVGTYQCSDGAFVFHVFEESLRNDT